MSAEPIRLAFLDTEFERCVPHVLSDPTDCSGLISAGKDSIEFGYTASSVVRQATAEDIERWRSES